MSLRIIGGELKGKRLATVRGTTTRPTADRLRETIFNILYTRVRKTVVLDLFAGTGAMGIEALSRGAEYAALVDNNRNAYSVIKKNIISCSLENKTAIIKRNVLKKLDLINSIRPWFDLVFMDPPYNRNLIKPALKNLDKSRLLKKEASIIIEHSDSDILPEKIDHFTTVDQRRYGKTMITFFKYH